MLVNSLLNWGVVPVAGLRGVAQSPVTPAWLQRLVYFAGVDDLIFAVTGLALGTLLFIWWRQQTSRWLWVVIGTFLSAWFLSGISYLVFVVPPYYVHCPSGCLGWRGYPLPFATLDFDGNTHLYPLDFGLNLLLLWLLWLGASVVWRFLGEAVEWQARTLRFKIAIILIFGVLPWAYLPRFFNPPQPEPVGEELRLAINAQRAAESTYNITGLWIQRLALEDIRGLRSVAGAAGDSPQFQAQVCLRGYTYFYIPWQRYRITLDVSGVTALNLTVRPLRGSCWE